MHKSKLSLAYFHINKLRNIFVILIKNKTEKL